MRRGYVTIGGRRFSIEETYLQEGEFKIVFSVPPGHAFKGPITVFGYDGVGCWQGRTMLIPDRKATYEFTYGMKVTKIENAIEELNVQALPGFEQ